MFEVDSIFNDDYKIDALLGQGGMGAVYRVRQLNLNRTLALKVLHASLADDDENVARFRREAKILANLEHPNIVTFYNFGVSKEGLPFIAMEYLRGRSLSAVLAECERMEPERALLIMLQICEALHCAHAANVFHRDMKPQNVLLVDKPAEDTVKIVDLGLAKLAPASQLNTGKLTKTGLLVGTPHYMSPEQVTGKTAVDVRTDIYACGCILYEMVTGRKPFDADNHMGIIYQHCNNTAADFESICKGLPAIIERICFKAMEKEPANRYQSMTEMIADLSMALANKDGLKSSIKEQQTSNVAASGSAEKIEKPNLVFIGIGILFAALATFFYYGYIKKLDAEKALKAERERAAVMDQIPSPPSFDDTRSVKTPLGGVDSSTDAQKWVMAMEARRSDELRSTAPKPAALNLANSRASVSSNSTNVRSAVSNLSKVNNEPLLPSASVGDKLKRQLALKAEMFLKQYDDAAVESELAMRKKLFESESLDAAKHMLLFDPISQQGFYSASFHFTLQQLVRHGVDAFQKHKLAPFSQIEVADVPYLEIVVSENEDPSAIGWHGANLRVIQNGNLVSISGIGELRVSTKVLNVMKFRNTTAIIDGVHGDLVTVGAVHANLLITGSTKRATIVADRASILNLRNLDLQHADVRVSQSCVLLRAMKAIKANAKDNSIILYVESPAAVKVTQSASLVAKSSADLGVTSVDAIRSRTANPIK